MDDQQIENPIESVEESKSNPEMDIASGKPETDTSERREDQDIRPQKKKKGPFGIFLRILFVLILIPLAAVLVGWVGSLLDRSKAEDYLPQDLVAYLHIESLEDLTIKILELDAADIYLAGDDWGEIRSQVVELRNQDFWSNPWFKRLLEIPLHGAYYAEEDFLVVADLGWRSIPFRLVRPLADRIPLPMAELQIMQTKPYLLLKFQDKAEGSVPIFVGYKGNLLLLTSSSEIMSQAFSSQGDKVADLRSWAELPDAPRGTDLRVILQSQALIEMLAELEGPAAQTLNLISFPQYSALDIQISNEELFLQLSLPVESDHPGLSELLRTQSGVPAIMNELSDQVEYSTVIALGTPAELMDQLDFLMTPEISQSMNQADQALRLAMGMTLEDLVFSWVGRELGVFALKNYPEPVFFFRIEDEKKRQEVFDNLFSQFYLNQEDSLVMDDIRVRQMTLPWYLRGILESLEVDLPEPYFLVEKDFIYFSSSAEALAVNVQAVENNDSLIRTDEWKAATSRLSSASSVQLYYNLNRSLPFFLQGQGELQEALSLYRQGIASLAIEGDRMVLRLSAQQGSRDVLSIYPGFPLERRKKLSSPVIALVDSSNKTRLYWMEGDSRLVEYQPASGELYQAELDDQAWLLPHPMDNSLWAVSRRGAIYRYNEKLQLMEGYPQLTGRRLSTAPTAWQEGLYLADRESQELLFWQAGEESVVQNFDAPLLSPVNINSQGFIATYPKSFLGQVHLLSPEGIAMEGWPIDAAGISFGSPFFIPRGDSFQLGFLTQAGQLKIYSTRGQVIQEMELPGVFYQNPQWAPGSGLIYALSEDGVLFQINLNGQVRQKKLDQVSGDEARLILLDLDGDRQEEIFISRAAGILFGYDKDFQKLEGFPVPGGWDPALADLNGDGSLEILSGGYDKTIGAFRLP